MANQGRSDPIYDIFKGIPETEFVIDSGSDSDSSDSDSDSGSDPATESNKSSSATESSSEKSPDTEERSSEEVEVAELAELAELPANLGPDVPVRTEILENGDEVITNQAIDMQTLAPEPVPPQQRFCVLTYAPHLETRTVYVIVSGCFGTFEEADRFSQILHSRDPRWNRSVGETGRPLPIPLDRRLFVDNPIIRGAHLPVVPFNIISENIDSGTGNSVSGSDSGSESDTTPVAPTEVSVTPIPSSTASVSVVLDSNQTEVKEVSKEVSKQVSEKVNAQEDDTESDEVTNANCLTCISKERSALFMPCRHIVFCLDCAKIHTSQSDLCAICRTPIKEVLNVFL